MKIAGHVLQELALLGQMAGFGAAAGIVYDGLRICRKGIPHRQKWIDREDLVFWICAGLCFFLFLVNRCEGKIRLYTILAVFAGAFLYHISVSRFVVGCGGFLFVKAVRFVSFWGQLLTKAIKRLKNASKRVRLCLYGLFTGEKAGKKRQRGHKKDGKSRIQKESCKGGAGSPGKEKL